MYDSFPSRKHAGDLLTLAACWFVAAGLAFLFGASFGLFLSLLGLYFISLPTSAGPELAFTGKILIALGALSFLLSLLVAFLRVLVARSIQKRRRLTLIYAMAFFICLSIPLATILGIFTLTILSRPSIKSTFQPH